MEFNEVELRVMRLAVSMFAEMTNESTPEQVANTIKSIDEKLTILIEDKDEKLKETLTNED